jgi:predicted kinase
VARSTRWAEGAGLLDPDPLGPLRTELRGALAGLPDDAADRGWAAARAAHAAGRPAAEVRGAALDPRWRAGRFPRLVLTSGPSGSGKSTAVAGWPGVDETVSMDDLRAARGARADQRGNADVLRTGLAHLDAALRPGRTVVWDATCLDRAQREVVRAVGHRRGALVTTAVLLVPPEVVLARNDARPHRVPAAVLRDQLHRFGPPYPGETHRTWYLGEAGTVDDVAGSVRDAPP